MSDIESTWRRYIQSFKSYLKLERGLADNSVEAYMLDVRHLEGYGVDKGIEPDDVKLEDLQQLLNVINEMGIAATSQRRMISGWRMFYRMLVVEDAMSDSPAEMLDLPMRG